MSTTDFSQPIYAQDDEQHEAGDVTTAGAAVDLNDPSLLSAEFDIDPTADPYAVPPPIPDGRYRAKLKQIDVKNAAGEMVRYAVKPLFDYRGGAAIPVMDENGHQKYFVTTALECRIQDPSGKYDNAPVYDRFMDSRTARNGGVPLVRVLTVLGVALPPKLNAKTLIDTFMKALAGEPDVEITTAWEANLGQEDQELFKAQGVQAPRRVTGMHNFPVVDGKRVPEIQRKTVLGDFSMRAQAKITGYYALGSGKLGPFGK